MQGLRIILKCLKPLQMIYLWASHKKVEEKKKANDDDRFEAPAKLGKQEIWMLSN